MFLVGTCPTQALGIELVDTDTIEIFGESELYTTKVSKIVPENIVISPVDDVIWKSQFDPTFPIKVYISPLDVRGEIYGASFRYYPTDDGTFGHTFVESGMYYYDVQGNFGYILVAEDFEKTLNLSETSEHTISLSSNQNLIEDNDEMDCFDDMALIIKSRTGDIVCVRSLTADKLVQRGWGSYTQ